MSKWGSWVSGAVAGLENRLDRVLAEDDQASSKERAAAIEKAQKDAASATPSPAEQPKAEPGMRTASRNRPNNRLQERLAKAMVKDGRTSSRTSMDVPSRTANPTTVDTTRSSIDSKRSETVTEGPQASEIEDKGVKVEEASSDKTDVETTPATSSDASKPTDTQGDVSIPATSEPGSTNPPPEDVPASRQSLEQTSLPIPTTGTSTQQPEISLSPRPKSPNTLESELELLQTTHTQSLKDHHDEVHAHLERIDALQSKLSYLSDQLATAAKTASEEASASTPDKKLAEKDVQIAELLKEGEKLSKKELQHSNLIKKLRVKIGEQDKDITELNRRINKAEQSTIEERERAKRAEAADRATQEKLKIVARIEKEVDEIRREKETAAITITELRKQLADSVTRAEQAEKKAQTGALEAEQRKNKELEEELADAKIEKKLVEDRSRAEVRDIKEESSRQAEKAKVTELELKGEISNLETKLEVLRSRTEEVSSTGDSQTKLLRQIETLQTQYALASENWQGIESTLTSRVAALEKERDDISKRESDIRRKARDVNSKARKLEDELEAVNDRSRTLEQDVQEQRTSTHRLEAKANLAETELQDARADFDRQRKVWEAEFNQRLEMEKAKWKTENVTQTPTDASFLRAESPSAVGSSFRKHSAADLAGLGLTGIHTRRTMGRANSGMINTDLKTERPESRRGVSGTSMPVRTPELGTPRRQDSTPSLTGINGGMSQAPSIHAIMDEDFDTLSSPRPTINDVISASTAGAGPSVQLVERMSAAVRRLESEKATTKEEMARMIAQRDEARSEVVALMRELDEKRATAEQVQKLQEEIKQVDARYQTTLEMLGEKSERVEELTIDVQDLKKIYRDLVERTMSS